MSDTNFAKLPTAPAGFVWVDGAHCVRVADIQAVRSEYLSVRVYVRGWDAPIEVQAPGGVGQEMAASLLGRMRAAEQGGSR